MRSCDWRYKNPCCIFDLAPRIHSDSPLMLLPGCCWQPVLSVTVKLPVTDRVLRRAREPRCLKPDICSVLTCQSPSLPSPAQQTAAAWGRALRSGYQSDLGGLSPKDKARPVTRPDWLQGCYSNRLISSTEQWWLTHENWGQKNPADSWLFASLCKPDEEVWFAFPFTTQLEPHLVWWANKSNKHRCLLQDLQSVCPTRCALDAGKRTFLTLQLLLISF